ncbi:zinc finger protein, putative [Hepatocystis sp. ex Piliocolobus tephrosceles]|nr:zinc finger protein, putative [Hepatocystis sp. ex Piliocolobus tephrosceles]
MKKTCEVCKKKTFQYVCPSCEIVYCSLECYKQHNDKCVNNFLNNQVNENIKNNVLTDLDIKDFKFKLKNFYDNISGSYFVSNQSKDNAKNIAEVGNISDEESDKSEDADSMSEEGNDNMEDADSISEEENNKTEGTSSKSKGNTRDFGHLKKWCISNKRYKVLTNLAVNNQLDLKDLNKTEKKQFFSFIKNNDMNLYLKEYIPWWLDCVIKKMEIPEHICCNKTVNENIIYIIIEIIYSYCYLLRIYNNSIYNKEFCYLILYIAPTLNRFSIPETNILNTLNGIFERILQNDDIAREKKVLYNVLTDVNRILSLKDLVLRCLYETNKKIKKEIKKIDKKKKEIYANLNGKEEKKVDNDLNNKKKMEKKLVPILQEQHFFKYVYKKVIFLYSYSNYHYEKFSTIQKQILKFYNEQTNFLQLNEKREIVLAKGTT